MTICPGKKGASPYGRPWDRDLGVDIEAVRAWRPDVVIILMEVGEFAYLGVRDLGSEVKSAGMWWFHLPIPDTKAPDCTGSWPTRYRWRDRIHLWGASPRMRFYCVDLSIANVCSRFARQGGGRAPTRTSDISFAAYAGKRMCVASGSDFLIHELSM
jgi:hypothetical protein